MFEIIGFSEIDKSAIEAYCCLNNVKNSQNYGDIRNINKTNINADIELLFGGTPCTDFSSAGLQQGCTFTCTACNHSYNPLKYSIRNRLHCPLCGKKITTETQSALLVEYLRVIKETHPKVAIWENVAVVAKYRKYKDTFDSFINELKSYGYNTYIHFANTLQYGLPQNRHRVFVVAIDRIFDNCNVKLTNSGYRKLSISDILQPAADIPTNHWISDVGDTDQQIIDTISNTCTQSKVQQIYNIIGYIPQVFGLRNTSDLQRFPCITTNSGSISGDGACLIKQNNRLRKITVQECFMLQGFSNAQFNIINSLDLSERTLRTLAGNSITIDVLISLFRDLYSTQPHLFSNKLNILSVCSGIGTFELALEKFYNMHYTYKNTTIQTNKYTAENCLLQYSDMIPTVDVCDILRIHRHTLHNLIINDKLNRVAVANKFCISKASLIAFLNATY